MPEIGRLRAILKGIGASRITAAAACNVDLRTIDRINKGEWETMAIGTLMKVSVGLGVRCTDLVPELHARPAIPGLVGLVRDQRRAEREHAKQVRKDARRKVRQRGGNWPHEKVEPEG